MTMTGFSLASLTCLACALPAFATASPKDFQALEDRLSGALASYDRAAVSELWDGSFVFVFPNGHVSHRAERLAGLTPPHAGQATTLTSHNDSVEVQYEDAKIAIVTVRSTWRSGATKVGDPYLATHVWIRRGVQWRLLSAQVAHVSP